MTDAPRQTTLAAPAELQGTGLHTGVVTRVRLRPAPADHGVVFVRADLPGSPRVFATPDAVNREALRRRTELVGESGAVVATTEHLLATCLVMGLDNLLVELDGPELPILDGSAKPYADLIDADGLTELAAPRRFWRLSRPVVLVNEHAELTAVPAEQMRAVFFAPLEHAGLANESASTALDPKKFARDLAPARTFVFYEEIQKLFDAGLIRGGSLDCALVIRDGRPVNGDYRMPQELARHKLLDLLGDLAMLGRPVCALITARGSGHALNHAFIELLRKDLTE